MTASISDGERSAEYAEYAEHDVTGLPILRTALEISSMAPLLQPLVGHLANGGPRSGMGPQLAHAKLLAYKRGNRGTVRYDLVTGSGRPITVLGKLYPQPAQVVRVDAILRELRDRFGDECDLVVPEPLGTLTDLSMLVYLPVEGAPLDEALVGDHGQEAVKRTARWLAALHRARLPLDRRVQLETEVVNLQAWASLVGRAHPSEAARASRLAEDLAASVGAARAVDETPIHKDFHYQHVLVGRRLGVIDFDEVRYGDPTYDVAHFCAHLRLLAGRSNGDAARVAATEGDFLGSYARYSGRPLGDSFPWYAAYTCLKIAKQLSTVRGPRPHPEGSEKLRQLVLILDEGMAFCDLLR